jgi:DNA-binding transcriptional ArsR family regulator
MPRHIEPAAMPRGVSAAIETIGNRVRTEILRALHSRGPLTTTELAEHVATRRETVHYHLTHLEEAGLVTGDQSGDDRARRRVVRWTIQADAVRATLTALGAYIFDE